MAKKNRLQELTSKKETHNQIRDDAKREALGLEEEKDDRLSMRIEPTLKELALKKANSEGRALSWYIRKWLVEWLEGSREV